MKVAVVVPTKDSAATLGDCLRSIRAQTHAVDELVVVDNFSSDATQEHASSLADTLLVAGPERGTQRNLGWKSTTSDVVLFIDSDMWLDPGVVEGCLSVLAADPSIGCVVIPELARGEGLLGQARALEKRLYLGDPKVEGARAFRRTCLEQTGGYDERFVGGEDWDLPDRVRAAGWGVGRCAAEIWHEEGKISLRAQWRKKRYYGRGVASYRATSPVATQRSGARASLISGRALLTEPLAYLALVVLKVVEVTATFIGMREGRPR